MLIHQHEAAFIAGLVALHHWQPPARFKLKLQTRPSARSVPQSDSAKPLLSTQRRAFWTLEAMSSINLIQLFNVRGITASRRCISCPASVGLVRTESKQVTGRNVASTRTFAWLQQGFRLAHQGTSCMGRSFAVLTQPIPGTARSKGWATKHSGFMAQNHVVRRGLSRKGDDGEESAASSGDGEETAGGDTTVLSRGFLSTLMELAAAGDPDSQFKLASLYFKGEGGVPKDLERAAYWVELAAESGVAQAQYNFAGLCFSGVGVPEDRAAGAEWYRRAADAGHAEAQHCYGELLYAGEGVSKDRKAAEKYLLQAAEQGAVLAQHKLGILYTMGMDVGKNFQAAAAWMGKAAEQGHAESQAVLATMLYKGQGVAQDEEAAAEWMRRAAEGGVPDAMHNMGGFYFNGIGVQQDAGEAARWFGKAAEAGHRPSQEMLIAIQKGATPAAAAPPLGVPSLADPPGRPPAAASDGSSGDPGARRPGADSS